MASCSARSRNSDSSSVSICHDSLTCQVQCAVCSSQSLAQFQGTPQYLLLAPAKQGERAMRRDRLQGFLIGEVVAELRARFLLAVGYRRRQQCMVPKMGAQARQ